MIEINQTLKWTKVDKNDSATWPLLNTEGITIMTKIPIQRWHCKSNVFTGYLHNYKTRPPKFRIYFSLQKDELELDEIDCWTIINTKLNGK